MHLFIILALYLLDSFPATTIWADLDYCSLINTLLKERASPDHPNLKSFQAFLCPGASELHIIQVPHSVTSQNHLKAKNSYKNCLSMYPPVCNNKKKYLSGKDAHKYYYSLLETTINRTIINCILFWEREGGGRALISSSSEFWRDSYFWKEMVKNAKIILHLEQDKRESACPWENWFH